MTSGRVIRTSYPAICSKCGRVIRRGRFALWDGQATCMGCVEKAHGVAPRTKDEIDEDDRPVDTGRRGSKA